MQKNRKKKSLNPLEKGQSGGNVLILFTGSKHYSHIYIYLKKGKKGQYNF